MGVRTLSMGAQAPRDPSQKGTDRAALRAIAQAAVEVELFTIPLYMTSLYSIQGMHQITSHGNDFYTGRLWPGSATTAAPDDRQRAGVQHRLLGVHPGDAAPAAGLQHRDRRRRARPIYTTSALQTNDNGWTCYGPTVTVIPHIIDLQDTITFNTTVVDLGPLTAEQLNLFLADRAAGGGRPQGHRSRQAVEVLPDRAVRRVAGRAIRCRCSARSAGCTTATTRT